MTIKMNKKPKEEQPPDPEATKKKQDVLTKAKNKLFNISEALKSNKNLSLPNQSKKGITKSKTQVNLEQFCKQSPGKNQIYYSPKSQVKERRPIPLQKQNSVGSYPIIEITDENNEIITNKSRSNLYLDKMGSPLDTEALALEKPRKKLSFRLPEIVDTITNSNKLSLGGLRNKSNSYRNIRDIIEKASARPQSLISSVSLNGVLERSESFDDSELESQAMRVVRTIGQAFEVCHKLSVNNPENEHLDQDEQDTLTQDLLSDRLSDITSDKPKRDIMSEGASDRMSLPPDDCSFKDLDTGKNNRTPGQLDIIPPPPNNNINMKHILTSAEMYSSPHSDGLTTGSAESGGSLPPPGTALSTHHELQLMREQLEQQTQQTQAALAQLQLAREQLAAEQAARLEAQARTHQLLIHNRELLDHIASLVGHLQGSEKSGQQSTPPHMTMPQQQAQQNQNDTFSSDMYEYADVGNPVGWSLPGLPENRNSTAFLPTSPLRSSLNPGANIFNFSYPQSLEAATFENQLIQKLHALNNFPPATPFNPYSQSFPFMLQNLYSSPLNNTFPLQNPPQKNIFMNKAFMGGRHSEPRQLNPNYFNQSPPSKKEDYHSPQYTTLRQQNYSAQQATDTYQQKESDSPIYQKIIPKKDTEEKPMKNQKVTERIQRESSPNSNQSPTKKQNNDNKEFRVQENDGFKREASPRPQHKTYNDKNNTQFIKPYSQIGTLTTTDTEGRLRVVVPVLSSSREDLSDTFGNLRTDDKYKSSLSRTSSDRFSRSRGTQDTPTRHKTK